jgi:alkylhydroperoxidase family enzyme
MSRLQPLPREELGELESAFQTFQKRMGFVANSGLIMARRPAILKTLAELARAILEDGRVPLALKNCICEIASKATGCLYCQAHFANNMLRSGIEPQKLAELWNFERSPLYSAAERAALSFTIAASQVPNAVDDAVFAELQRHWDDGQIVEILATVCYVGFLNRWNDSLATTLEEIPTQAAQAHLVATRWQPGKHAAKTGMK